MENLIKQAFLHVETIGPHVMEGHYDLIGPDGEIILPQVWDTMIKPDHSIEMQMWPLPEIEKMQKGQGGPSGPADVGALLAGIAGGAVPGGGGGGGKTSGKGKGKKSKHAAPAAVVMTPPPPPPHGLPTRLPSGIHIPPPPGMPSMNLESLVAGVAGPVATGGESKKKKSNKGPVSGFTGWMLGPGPKKKK